MSKRAKGITSHNSDVPEKSLKFRCGGSPLLRSEVGFGAEVNWNHGGRGRQFIRLHRAEKFNCASRIVRVKLNFRPDGWQPVVLDECCKGELRVQLIRQLLSFRNVAQSRRYQRGKYPRVRSGRSG